MSEEKKINVRLLSDVCMQSRLLKDSLESKLPISIDISPLCDTWMNDNSLSSYKIQLVIIDYSRVDENNFADYSAFKRLSGFVA